MTSERNAKSSRVNLALILNTVAAGYIPVVSSLSKDLAASKVGFPMRFLDSGYQISTVSKCRSR
jgi:hypothetical protein